MLSYEVYKVLHIFSIVLFAALAGVNLAKDNLPKVIKVFTGVSSFFILVAGFGLLSRIGVSHSSGFPSWVIIKMLLWLGLAAMFGIISKRGVSESNKSKAGIVGGVLFLSAILMAVYKSI